MLAWVQAVMKVLCVNVTALELSILWGYEIPHNHFALLEPSTKINRIMAQFPVIQKAAEVG